MAYAWVSIGPEKMMSEIERSIVRMKVIKSHFVVRVLTPLYPLDKLSYTDKNFYNDQKATEASLIKEQKLIIKEL